MTVNAVPRQKNLAAGKGPKQAGTGPLGKFKPEKGAKAQDSIKTAKKVNK